MKKFGPQIQPHLDARERLLDVVYAIAIKNAPTGLVQHGGEPITGTGATAGRLMNEMPQRTSGVVCVTDRRVLYFGTGVFRVKRMWWEISRKLATGVSAGDGMFFSLRFADGLQAWFGGGRHDCKAVAGALGLAGA